MNRSDSSAIPGRQSETPPRAAGTYDQLVERLQRSFVELRVAFIADSPRTSRGSLREEARIQVESKSAFLIRWRLGFALVTAGHVIDNLLHSERRGRRMHRAELVLNRSVKGRGEVPRLSVDRLRGAIVHLDSRMLDFAIVPLPTDLARTLERRGSLFLDESRWEQPISDPDGYIVMGLPGYLHSAREKLDGLNDFRAMMRRTLLTMPLLAETASWKPQSLPAGNEGLESVQRGEFRARIKSLRLTGAGAIERVEDLAGMSGGPIYALRREGTSIKYSLLAVQSGWYAPDLEVVGCLLAPRVREAIGHVQLRGGPFDRGDDRAR